MLGQNTENIKYNLDNIQECFMVAQNFCLIRSSGRIYDVGCLSIQPCAENFEDLAWILSNYS